MNFDFNEIDTTTFGVCTRRQGNIVFLDVPVDVGVVQNLREMVLSTWEKMHEVADDPDPYEPANEATGQRHLAVPINDDMVELFRDVNEADHFDPGGEILVEQPGRVFSYFARFTDNNGERLTAMRRSTEFKGVLRHRHRLVRIVNDTLRMAQDDIFRLDTDFDLLIASDEVRILRPAGFETIGRLQEVIRAAVPQNTEALQASLGFVNFAPIEEFAAGNVGAARLLASIRTRGVVGISMDSLWTTCRDNGVDVDFDGIQLNVEGEAVLGFLRTLDRRRFSTELIPGEREVYDASNRRRV